MVEYEKDGAVKFATTPEQAEIFEAAGWVKKEEEKKPKKKGE